MQPHSNVTKEGMFGDSTSENSAEGTAVSALCKTATLRQCSPVVRVFQPLRVVACDVLGERGGPVPAAVRCHSVHHRVRSNCRARSCGGIRHLLLLHGCLGIPRHCPLHLVLCRLGIHVQVSCLQATHQAGGTDCHRMFSFMSSVSPTDKPPLQSLSACAARQPLSSERGRSAASRECTCDCCHLLRHLVSLSSKFGGPNESVCACGWQAQCICLIM